MVDQLQWLRLATHLEWLINCNGRGACPVNKMLWVKQVKRPTAERLDSSFGSGIWLRQRQGDDNQRFGPGVWSDKDSKERGEERFRYLVGQTSAWVTSVVVTARKGCPRVVFKWSTRGGLQYALTKGVWSSRRGQEEGVPKVQTTYACDHVLTRGVSSNGRGQGVCVG